MPPSPHVSILTSYQQSFLPQLRNLCRLVFKKASAPFRFCFDAVYATRFLFLETSAEAAEDRKVREERYAAWKARDDLSPHSPELEIFEDPLIRLQMLLLTRRDLLLSTRHNPESQ